MYSGPVIDCDIHHTWPTDDELDPYLSPQWREYAAGAGRSGPIPKWVESGYYNPHGVNRRDATAPSGERPGSSLAMLREKNRRDLAKAGEAAIAVAKMAAIRFPKNSANAMNAMRAKLRSERTGLPLSRREWVTCFMPGRNFWGSVHMNTRMITAI